MNSVQFMADGEPGRWDVEKLAHGAGEVIRRGGHVTPRQWFSAGNNLALASALAGADADAIGILQVAIQQANAYSRRHPDAIEFGVEPWLNLVDLKRKRRVNGAVDVLRACYDVVLGRRIARSHLFGLELARIRDADLRVSRRALGIVRNRSQSGLLAALLGDVDRKAPVAFAREVVCDYPVTVRAGMVHAAEVLALHDTSHPFLREANLLTPRWEFDFGVLLRVLEVAPATVSRRMQDFGKFDDALLSFAGSHHWRNPRTPLLWRVQHALVTKRSVVLSRVAREALRSCRKAGDLRLHQRIVSMVDGRVPVEPIALPSKLTRKELAALSTEFQAACRPDWLSFERSHLESSGFANVD